MGLPSTSDFGIPPVKKITSQYFVPFQKRLRCSSIPAPVLMSFMFAGVADCVPFLTPRPTSSWSASRSSVQRALRTSRPSGCLSESGLFSQQCTSTCKWFRQADTTIRFSCRIAHHCPQTPKILVGTKLDMRKDPQTLDKMRERKQQPIEYSQVRPAFEVR
jgi:hypothetical protein